MGNRTKRRARRAEQVPAARAERKERRRRQAEHRRHLAVLLSTTLELTDELADQLELEGWPRERLAELGNAGRRYSPERDSFFGPVVGRGRLSRLEFTRTGRLYHEAAEELGVKTAPCSLCGGSGNAGGSGMWVRCSRCKGHRKEVLA